MHFLITLFFGSAIAAQTTLSLSESTVNFDVSDGAAQSKKIDRQLVSLSIEFCNTVDYLGDVNKPNLFSRQLLQNIQDRVGVPPMIRLGGNTQDKSYFCENCPDTIKNIFKADTGPLATESTNATYSKAIFKVMEENVPSKQTYIFGLNLGHDDYNTAQTQLTGALKFLKSTLVAAFEVGNEPNMFFSLQKVRPASYDGLAYGTQILDWLLRLQKSASNKKLIFQFGSMALLPSENKEFTQADLAKMGVPQRVSGVKILANHAYPQHMCTPQTLTAQAAALVTLEYYVNHLKTVDYFSSWSGEIAVAKSLGATFHMGETNSAACHGKDGVSNTMGALLWSIDYALYAATIGIDRLFFHNGVGQFYYALWEPLAINGTAPFINPQYYSLLFIADIIADLPSPTIYRVAHLDTYQLAHYAIYSRRIFQKLVILNTEFYNDTSIARPEKRINVSAVLGKKVKAKRLTAASTAAKNGIIWAGQKVDQSGKVVGRVEVESVRDGWVSMKASEGVVLERG